MYEGPEHIDGYRDLVRIGHGGFSVVYRARQVVFEREVAVKVLMVGSDEALQRRFLREARLTARLSGHPHVVTILDAGMTRSGRPYLATGLYDNGSLHDRLRAEGSLAAADVVSIGVKIADVLAVAHEMGIVHRDVKPSNILLSRYGEPVLADFGVAWLLDGQSSATMLDVFSPHHVAPETVNGGRPGPASDIYALGSTLFQLLRGSAPFSGDADDAIAAVLWRTVHDPAPRIECPDLPGLADVLSTAMAKDPADRYPGAGAFADALRALLRPTGSAGLTPASLPAAEPDTRAAVVPIPPALRAGDETIFRPERSLPPSPKAVRPGSDRRFLAAVLTLGIIAVAAGVAIALRPGRGSALPPVETASTVLDTALLDSARPTGLTVQDDQTSALLRWTVPAGRSDQLFVQVLSADTGLRPRIQPVATAGAELRVEGLDPDLGYCFLVGAVVLRDRPSVLTWSRPRCIRDAELRGPLADAPG